MHNYEEVTHRDLINLEYMRFKEFLTEGDSWDAGRVREWTWLELRRSLDLAWKTRGYRALYKGAGLHGPRDVRNVADFSRLPTVTKEMIRDDLDAFTIPIEGSTYSTTGGSTGIPFGFYYSPGAFARTLAARAHLYSRRGWREGDRQFVLRGSSGGSGELNITSADHMEYVPDLHELRASAAYLEPENIKHYLAKAWEYRPEWLRVYPSAGFLLARHLRKTGERFPPIKGILSSAENLYPHQKALMEEVFEACVFSHYGHMEQAALAGMCERSDLYHVFPFYGYVELLDRNGDRVTRKGATGEITATSFIMQSTLFVRYRTKDFAVFAGMGCEQCGRPHQLWSAIEGRLQEYAVTGSGRLVAMTSLNMYDDVYDCIKQFQFRQKEPGKIEFAYVPRDRVCTSEQVEQMRLRIVGKFEDDMEVNCVRVDAVPLTGRGKHRFLVQKLIVDDGRIGD